MTKSNKRVPRPAEVELEILNILWANGPSTVRHVHGLMSEKREVGYSSTLKMMQVMRDKGLLERDASVRPQVYRPTYQQRQTQTVLLRDLASRAFGGSIQKMVMSLVDNETLSRDELRELKKSIRRAEKEQA